MGIDLSQRSRSGADNDKSIPNRTARDGVRFCIACGTFSLGGCHPGRSSDGEFGRHDAQRARSGVHRLFELPPGGGRPTCGASSGEPCPVIRFDRAAAGYQCGRIRAFHYLDPPQLGPSDRHSASVAKSGLPTAQANCSD